MSPAVWLWRQAWGEMSRGGWSWSVTVSPGFQSILSSSAASVPPSLQRWTRSCSSAAERATPPHGWKYQSHQRIWPGRRSKSYDWYSFSIPENSNKKLPATMLWWLCSSFLTSDALIQAPAICTCLEGKCWPSIPRRDTNRAHFNVNNPPWRGSMINVSFSCHGLILNLGDTAFHCKLLSQDLDPVLPRKPCIISYRNLNFSSFDLFTLHFANTSSTGRFGLLIPTGSRSWRTSPCLARERLYHPACSRPICSPSKTSSQALYATL